MVVTLVFIAAFLAFIVSAVAGGGAGLVLVPLLRLILPVAAIPGALSIGTATSSVSRIWLFRTRIRWDVVRWLPSIATSGEIVMIEKVHGEGHYYEIYRQHAGVVSKVEVTPDGTPRHRALLP